MIPFRYYVVTIVAILLAMALGVLAGATFVSDPFVRSLRARTSGAEASQARAEAQSRALLDFISSAMPYLTAGKLTGVDAVVVTQEGSDPAITSQSVTALNRSGAQVLGIVTVKATLAAPEPGPPARELATLLGRSDATAEELPTIGATAIADRLAIGPARRSADDLLQALMSGGYIDYQDTSGTALADVGGPGQAIVAVAGGDGRPVVAPEAFLVPMIEDLVRAGDRAPVAAAEGATSDYGFVRAVRDDNANIPSGAAVTVDDVDETGIGGAALVLGLADLIANPGQGGGDYGQHGDSPIPGLAPSSTAG